MPRLWGRPAAPHRLEPVEVLVAVPDPDARTLAADVARRRLVETDEPTVAILADYLDHVGAGR